MDIRIKNFDDLCKKGVYCITNTQNNNIDFGLNRESRQRVIDAVMSIINQKDNNEDEEGL